MKKFLSLVLPLSLIIACTTMDESRVQKSGDNKFNIASGHMANARFVAIENIYEKWQGDLAGKENMQARKDYLLAMAEKEAAHLCGELNTEQSGKPDFDMQDINSTVREQGTWGFIKAEARPTYQNVPTGIHYRFKCIAKTEHDDEQTAVQE